MSLFKKKKVYKLSKHIYMFRHLKGNSKNFNFRYIYVKVSNRILILKLFWKFSIEMRDISLKNIIGLLKLSKEKMPKWRSKVLDKKLKIFNNFN
jgi:hypothetical protein